MTSNGQPSGRMREFLRNNLLGLVAIFIALSGTAYAVQANSVKSKHIVDGQVAGVDLGANSVNSAKVVNESLGNADINSLDTSSICTGCLSGEDISENTIRGVDIDEPTLKLLIAHESFVSECTPTPGVVGGDGEFSPCDSLEFELQRAKPVLVMMTYGVRGVKNEFGGLECQLRYDQAVQAEWDMIAPRDDSGFNAAIGGVPIVDVVNFSSGIHTIALWCHGDANVYQLRTVALELGLEN